MLGPPQQAYGYGPSGTSGPGNTYGMGNSVAVVFDMNNGTGNETGLITGGVTPVGTVDMTSSGVSLHSGHLLQVTLTYNGTTLTQQVKDLTSGSTFSTSYSTNIPSLVGGNTAYIGFAAANGTNNSAQAITNLTFT